MTRLVAVTGVAPGVGKSTLCTELREWASLRCPRVEHFREEEVLTCTAFAALAVEFTRTGRVALQTLLDSTEAYLADAAARHIDVVVTDALVPFVHSLTGWGHDEQAIAGFLRDLAVRLNDARPIVVYLNDDPRPRWPARSNAKTQPGKSTSS